MRASDNFYTTDGELWLGFDYDLQVWVDDGIVVACGHPAEMMCGCNQRRYAGQALRDIDHDGMDDFKTRIG